MESFYSYQKLKNDLYNMKKEFPFLEIGSIGKSVLGKEILYIKIGVGKKKIFYSGAYHANEWITSPLLVKFAKEYALRYVKNIKMLNVNSRQLFENTCLYIVPMVNPDGVDLVNYGLEKFINNMEKNNDVEKNDNEENDCNKGKNEELFTVLEENVDNSSLKLGIIEKLSRIEKMSRIEKLSRIDIKRKIEEVKKIAKNYPDILFPKGWKANIDGVDLNLQYPAGWENAKKIKFAQGFDKPAPRDYVGKKPLEAKEAIAIYNFTKKHNFEMVIAYHTQGKEIYWKFGECTPRKSEKIGKKFSEFSGYKLADVPYNSSFAGYKDWFIQEFNKPGYTIEAGIGENPIQMEQFEEIWKDNFGILGLGIEEIIN